MNTYTGSFSDYVVKTTPSLEEQRRSSTLPKKLTHGVIPQHSQTQTHTIGFKEAFKSKATLFGTLLRPGKRYKKKTKEDGEVTLARPSPKVSSAKHTQDLNYHNGELVSGHVNELIRLLVPTHEYYPSQNYIFTFILCSRLFMPPCNALKKICESVEILLVENKEHDKDIAKKLILLLVEWSEKFPYDFKDKLMMAQFGKCTRLCTRINPTLSTSVNMISTYLVKKFKDLLEYVTVSKEFHIQCDEEDKQLFDVCKDPALMADQLTIIELEKMSRITAEQFVERFIGANITCSRLDLSQQHSSTLEMYVSWFNRLSYLVATEICMCPVKKQRAKLINFFVEVGKNCFKKGNFNSLMAIIVGLSMNAVVRLKKTWLKSNQSGFKKLESDMSPQGNFHRYREILKQRLLSKENENVIPVFSILVKDIFFLNEGIKDKLPNNLINFEKFWQLSKQINDIMELKDLPCKYARDEIVLNYLKNTPVCNDEGIYKSSFEVEPPDSNFERDRYRSVRIRVGNR